MARFLFLLLAAAAASAEVKVEVVTTAGRIVAVLDDAKAPATTANFLRYVDERLYDEGSFHRTVTPGNQPQSPVKIEVVQASARSRDGRFGAIPLERTSRTGLRHVNGAISMARGAPDSATSDFFICIGDQPELDFGGKRNPDGQGFAAFGRVTEGMDVVRKIQQSPAEGQSLKPPVVIQRVRRLQ